MQNSGAERGSLLIGREGTFRVGAHLDLQDRGARARFGERPVSDENLVSEAIVRYTLRTGRRRARKRPSAGAPSQQDPYVTHHASKSILCMAVRHQNRVAGALFLENELASDAFTAERLELLRLLRGPGGHLARERPALRLDPEVQRALRSKRGTAARLLRRHARSASTWSTARGRPRLQTAGQSRSSASPSTRRRARRTTCHDQLYIAGTEQLYPVVG